MENYLEYKDEKSHKFWQIEVHDNTYTVTYGKVGTKGQSKTKEFETVEKALSETEKMSKAKIKKGYSYPNRKTTKDLLKLEIIDLSSLNESLYYKLEGDYETAIFISEDIFLDELDLDKLSGHIDVLIIDANLTVSKGILNTEGDYGVALIVTKDVTSDYIIGGGSEIYLDGNTTVKSLVYGYYNHGILGISNVIVPIVLTDDHQTGIYGKIEKKFDIFEDTEIFVEKLKNKPSFIFDESTENEAYYSIDSDDFIQYIIDDKNRTELLKQLLIT